MKSHDLLLLRLYEIKLALEKRNKSDGEQIDNCIQQNEKANNADEFAVLFGKLIRDVIRDSLQKTANAKGKGVQRKALERILKLGGQQHPEKNLNYPFISMEKQWFVNGFIGVGFDNPWDWEKCFVDDVVDMSRFSIKRNKPIVLPDIDKLRAYIKIKKAEKSKCIIFSFGHVVVNANFLLDMMEALPGAKAYSDENSKHSLYFESEEGVGLLLPVDVKAEATLL